MPPPDYIDKDVGYLMGLMVARGKISESPTRQLIIDFPYRSLKVKGVEKSIEQRSRIIAGLDDTLVRLRELTSADVWKNKQEKSIQLIIDIPRNTIFWRNLKVLAQEKKSYYEFEIPPQIFDADVSVKKEFMRGFADVAGSARAANRDQSGKHRIYLDVLNSNWRLPTQICYMLQDHLGIPVTTIIWGHPNLRDPNLKEYKRGNETAWSREHQIKVYAEDFEEIGLYISHKQEILGELAAFNRKNFGKSSPCSPPKTKIRRKPKHPVEKSKSLPKSIRGRHYDSYWQICCDLGCVRCAKQMRLGKKRTGRKKKKREK
jgi:hypothetical protein